MTIRERAFEAAEVRRARRASATTTTTAETERHHARRRTADERPAEALDDAGHGIEAVQRAPSLRHERRWIRRPASRTSTAGRRTARRSGRRGTGRSAPTARCSPPAAVSNRAAAAARGSQSNGGARHDAVPEHERDQDDERDARNRRAAPSTDAIGMSSRGKYTFEMTCWLPPTRLAAARRAPWRSTSTARAPPSRTPDTAMPSDGILRQLAEEDREHDHRHQRLDDRPAGAEHRLLVADLDVAPDRGNTAARDSAQISRQRAAAPARATARARRVTTQVSGGHQRRPGTRPSTPSPHGRLQCAAPLCHARQVASGTLAARSSRDSARYAMPVRTNGCELAADPSRERQRESLLRPIDGRGRQRPLERFVQQPLVAHQRRMRAEVRPDRVEQLVIDERHAHLESSAPSTSRRDRAAAASPGTRASRAARRRLRACRRVAVEQRALGGATVARRAAPSGRAAPGRRARSISAGMNKPRCAR